MKSTLILGKRGSGKSYLMSYLLAMEDYSLTIDTLGDFYKTHNPIMIKISSIPNIRLLTSHFMISIPAWAKAHSAMPKDIFDIICKLIIHYGRLNIFQRPFILAVDEIQYYCDRYDLPKMFSDIVNIGRHYNIYYYVNTRRYPEIHKDIIGNTEDFYAGASLDINDMNRLQQIYGKDNVNKFIKANMKNAFLHRNVYDEVCIVRIENSRIVKYSL